MDAVAVIRSLAEPLPPLRRDERTAIVALAILVALTRWLAVSRTLWDNDEASFVLAMRDFDVTAHHPHPPGFPLFILVARAVAAVTGLGGFHALQSVTVAASVLLFPAMFFMAREMRADVFTAAVSALFLAFLPNVWLFGGTAFSDVPSLVLVMTACALLLRGCRSDVALIAGAILLAVSVGFRPQNLLIGMLPALLALRHRPRTAVLGAFVGVAIIAATFGVAAELSGGWEAFGTALTRHEQYIRETDSFLAPLRPGLIQVADDFFIRPFRAWPVNVVVIVLAATALVRRRGWFAVAVFAPFLLFAWLYLDFHSASRFSIGYMPMFAFLSAHGVPRRGRTVILVVAVCVMVVWIWPALRIVRESASPPVAAAETIKREFAGATIWVDERLAPHAEALLPGLARRVVNVSPPFVDERGSVVLREGESLAPGARTFTRDRNRLAGIVRPRFFEVSLVPERRPVLPGD